MTVNQGLGQQNERKESAIEAVIFDMDGVLIDSEPIYFEIERNTFAHFGATLSDEEHHSYVGVTLESMWQQVLDKHQLNTTLEEALTFHKNNILHTMTNHPSLTAIPDVERWLRWLHEQKIPIAVASSSPHALIDIIMNKTGLGRYFERRVSGEEVENGKPAPDVFLHTANLLSVSPSHCLVIEDSRNGVLAAKAAGMRCIGYRNPGSGDQDLSKADLLVSSYEELWGLKDSLPFERR